MNEQQLVFEINRRRIMALMVYGLQYGTVTLIIEVAFPGVVLPPTLKPDKDGHTRLDYNLNFVTPPISDLRVDPVGVLATLSFSQAPFETFIPWTAVRNITWEHDIPVLDLGELDALAAAHLATLSPAVAAAPAEPPRRLRRITQLDVFKPEEQAEDAETTSQAFAAHGLRAV